MIEDGKLAIVRAPFLIYSKYGRYRFTRQLSFSTKPKILYRISVTCILACIGSLAVDNWRRMGEKIFLIPTNVFAWSSVLMCTVQFVMVELLVLKKRCANTIKALYSVQSVHILEKDSHIRAGTRGFEKCIYEQSIFLFGNKISFNISSMLLKYTSCTGNIEETIAPCAKPQNTRTCYFILRLVLEF